MTGPVVMASIFVSGFVAIQALGKWAHSVTKGLAFLPTTAVLVAALVALCNRSPEYHANPRTSVAMTATPYGD
jgi:hypothetical protein